MFLWVGPAFAKASCWSQRAHLWGLNPYPYISRINKACIEVKQVTCSSDKIVERAWKSITMHYLKWEPDIYAVCKTYYDVTGGMIHGQLKHIHFRLKLEKTLVPQDRTTLLSLAAAPKQVLRWSLVHRLESMSGYEKDLHEETTNWIQSSQPFQRE